MINFLYRALETSIIGVMTVITSNFIFDLLLYLISIATTYLNNVPTMMTPLLSSIFLTPKVIISGTISHFSYIVVNLKRGSYHFGSALLQAHIQYFNIIQPCSTSTNSSSKYLQLSYYI